MSPSARPVAKAQSRAKGRIETTGRAMTVVGIQIYSKIIPCKNACRYCLIGEKRRARIAPDRFCNLVERFIDWNEQQPRRIRIAHGIDYSSDSDVTTLKRELDLHKRLGWKDETRGIRLGGLPFRSDDQLRVWLQERRDLAAIRSVHASLAGHGPVHDFWHGRTGDFDLLYRTLSIAAELGLRSAQRLFLIKSTLPILEALLDTLDAIPGPAQRYLCQFYYRGWAAQLEAERITEKIRDHLPDRLAALAWRHAAGWHSEREWIERLRATDEASQHVHLKLELTENNIARVESLSCGEVIDELTTKTAQAYAAMPSLRELRDRGGDPTNRRIYMYQEDIEQKWLGRYLEKFPIQFERHRTHLAQGY